MLGMGAGPGADARYLFSEDALGHGVNHMPRNGKVYRNFKAEFERLQNQREAAFREFRNDTESGSYPELEHVLPIDDEDYEVFLTTVKNKVGRSAK